MNGDNDRTASFGDEAELEMEERFILVGSDSSPTRSSPEAHPGRVESQWWRRHAQANRAAKTISSIDQLDAVFIGDRLQEADDEDRALVEEFAQSLKQQLRTHQRKSTGSTASQPGKGSGRASAETPVSFDRRSASFSTVGLSVEEIRLLQSSSRREIPRTPPSQAKAIGQSLPSSAERSSAASPISTTGTPARSPISPRLLAFRDGGRPRPPASPLDSTTVHDDSSLVHTNGTARFTSPPPHAVPSSQSKSRPGPSAFFGDSAVRADRSESGTHSLGAALNRDLVLGLRAELAQVLRDRDKLLASVDQYRSEAEKQSEMFRTMSEQLNNAVFILEQTRIDNADLRDALMLEKSRTAKNEKEFQLFARKVKSLQEQNSELLAENDALRSELRKLQYEGATSKEASEFYKQRMSQLLYDNESLKSLAATLSAQNDRLYEASTQTMSDLNGSRSTSRGDSAAADRLFATSRADQGFAPSQQGRLPGKVAWAPTTVSDEPSSQDRAHFFEKMKSYEEKSPLQLRSSLSSIASTSPKSKLSQRSREGDGPAAFSVMESDVGPVDYISMRADCDARLKVLNDRKAKLSSDLQRIPLSGGSATLRRRKEDIEDELDFVDKEISGLRMKMRKFNLL